MTAHADSAPIAPAAPQPTADTPAFLQQAYDLTALSANAGATDTVAIVDAGDDPSAASDLATMRSTDGLPPCTVAGGCLRQVNESGQSAPLPAVDPSWQIEESIDIDAVSALCPNCHILLVEVASDSFSDLDTGVQTAAAMGAEQISISWSQTLTSPLTGTYTFPGIATVAASGDAGYASPGTADYPAALPGVTAAGGTTLTTASTQTAAPRGVVESAWSLAGGSGGGSGCDLAEPKPAFQTDSGCAGRSYADVSADGDPDTGLLVYDSAAGGWMLAGGTSLSAPLVAAYYGLTGLGSSPAWAYATPSLLNDITSGSTGSCAPAIGYICVAGPGYDGPTGVGSISGDVVAGAAGIAGPSYGSGTGNSYASAVSSSGATLSAGVYANGSPTTISWQYGTTSAYGEQTAATAIGSGSGVTATSTALSGLRPGTTYHCRLVAANADGVSLGYDSTLTTAGSAATSTGTATAPSAPTVPPAPGATAGAASSHSPNGVPVALSRPVIAGRLRTGSRLHVIAAFSPVGALSYRWSRSSDGGRSWSTIRHATRSVYVLGAADRRTELRVTVIASNREGSTSSTSRPIRPPVRSGAAVRSRLAR